ncbi:response regulator [Terricaulis sp.]|uniref:response regulator n=1 Tax=Terricaulis sp. TaxID=2768686 RepID=UPI003783F735
MLDEDPFDPSGLTALVLDENHYQRRISLDQLRTMGFGRAQGAADTLEAWELLKKSNPDIVLMEWADDGDGLDFVRRVRMSEELPNRAVAMFMLTSRGSAADVESARRAGVNGYLVKPISALVLQQRVKRVLTKPVPFIVTAHYVGPCRRRRRDEFYTGPMRRLDDAAPAILSPDEEAYNLKAELARARVAALENKARDFQPGDATAARAVFKATNELLEVAEMIGDPNLAFGAKEMMRYLQAQGATTRLDPEVVRTHIAALHQLVHLPHGMDVERERVAQSLKRMVDKKLKQAAA